MPPISVAGSTSLTILVLGLVLTRVMFRLAALIISLRGTKPSQRPEILRALAEVVHHNRHDAIPKHESTRVPRDQGPDTEPTE